MDKKAIIKALRDTAQSASNAIASNVSGPVDLLAAGLRMGGLNVNNPMGGSQWMQERGLTRDVEMGAPRIVGETLGMAGPALAAQFAPKIAGALNQGIDNAMAPATLNKQAGKVFVYPQDEALATAQRNAAKPVSEGGLGLPANNTPAQRAQAMGFTDDAYHGTDKVFDSFQANGGTGKTHGTGAFFSDNPSVASTYSGSRDSGSVIPSMLKVDKPVVVDANGQNWNYLGKKTKVTAPATSVADKEGDALMAALLGESEKVVVKKKAFSKSLGKLFPDDFRFNDSFSTDDLARWANNEGHNSMVFNGVKDRGPSGVFANAESALPSKNTVIFNPANIRSRFAAFDPARRNEADLLGRADPRLLGLIGLGTAGGAGAYNYMQGQK